ncbi:MAG TPA: DUF4382 domain-containing protein [Cyclobacteriaceae bacterium]|nr:DUF4382 domain-containing protein [Cyclobacteriaceae bacterium]
MKTVIVSWMKALAFGCGVILLISCDDPNEPAGKGNVQFEITDAPSDDANVRSVFVTVTDIKVDGKSIGGVTKTTLDLKAFSEGNTKVLAMASQFDAKAYGSVSLVLDLNNDANGASPGCYVQTVDGARYKLKNTADGTMEIVAARSFQVASNATTKVVLDFDVRKSIAYDANETVRYKFVSDRDLSAAVRLVIREHAGVIKGTYNENSASPSNGVIVYAYKKGTFSASTETQPQGENKTYFINAAGSSVIKSGLNGKVYTIAFLEEGDYELYFAAYEETPSGKASFTGLLQAETNVDGTVGNRITVKAGASMSISTVIKGIL